MSISKCSLFFRHFLALYLILLGTSHCGNAAKVLDAAGGEDTTGPGASANQLLGTWDGYLTTAASASQVSVLPQSRAVNLNLLADQTFVLTIIEGGAPKIASGTFSIFPDDQILFTVLKSELPAIIPQQGSFLTRIFRQENKATISNDYLTFTLTQTSIGHVSSSEDSVNSVHQPYTGLWRCQDDDFRIWKIEANDAGGIIAFAIFNDVERPLWLKGRITKDPDQETNDFFTLNINENNAGLSPLNGKLTLQTSTRADIYLEGNLSTGERFVANLQCDL